MTVQSSAKRNSLIATLADEFVVLHAILGGATKRLVAELVASGKSVRNPNGCAFAKQA